MTRGSSLTDEELAVLGVSRNREGYGNSIYAVQCAVCGNPVYTRVFNTDRVYKCKLCKDEIVKKRKAINKAEKERVERFLAEEEGIDYEHLHRFENAAAKFGSEYASDIEKARTVIEKFDSVPEVVACIELLHIGARVIVHQKVGDFTVDFCLPDEKLVVEIDGSLYHTDEAKEFMRDYAVMHMLGDGWLIRHIPADAVMSRHKVFGRTMKKLLNAIRDELGMKRL